MTTITTEPTTAPEVPAWLNLEAFDFGAGQEGFRSEVTGLLDFIDERLEDITYIARRVAELVERFESAIDGTMANCDNDVFGVLHDVTGMGKLDALARRIEAMFEGATNGTAPEVIR